jgi:serine phosphatase RsbU (regulator of sigma subunit)
MKDEDKTKEQLIHEVRELRQRIAAVTESETERKQTEEALREWASFAESNPAPVLRIGPDGKVTHANPAAYHIFGEGKLESRLIGEILPPLSKIDVGEYIRYGLVDTCDLTIGERSFQFVIMGVSDLGVGHIYGSDITERKRAEETMRLVNERMRQQLETARIIQQSFLPGHLPGIDDPRYSLAAANYPAAAVGGDYYDVIQIGPNCLGLVLGDVSGKGVPGAIYMARLVSDFRFLVEPKDDSPAETLTALNSLLHGRGHQGMYVTLLYLTLDLDTGLVTFANAGHLPMLVRRTGGQIESVDGDAGPPLGIIDNVVYDDSWLVLKPGEDMLLFTDGVTEARNSARESFSEERLLEILHRPHSRPEDLVKAVTDGVRAFIGKAPANDDLTLLAARWEGENPINGRSQGTFRKAAEQYIQ